MHQKLFLTVIICFSVYFCNGQEKIYTTLKINENILEIDGTLEDEPWKEVQWEGDFIQFEPNNGQNATQKTAFKILYDKDNIYIAIKAYDNEVKKIEKRMTRRDGWDGDRVGIYFDSYHDKRTSFVFFVNASGIKNDGILTDDGDNFDDSWDPIWYTKTSVDEQGWNAEIKIPLSQLRFSKKEEQKWGLQVERYLFRNSETSIWQPISKDVPGWTSHYGMLQGLNSLKPERQVEIAPFVVGQLDKYEKEAGNPFSTGKDILCNVGIDGKIGVTNNMILDFTINPDFGQVEADPSEVNLSAFETFFSEKRLFFIEGKNITNFQITPGGNPWSSDNLFYSRRIGRKPHEDPELDDNEYADMPFNTKILGAFKLTGKTNNGLSISLIESITNRETAEIDFEGQRREIVVEPYTNYLIGRIQKDINQGNTIIGGMFTATHRQLFETNLDYLSSSAFTGGIDFTQYFAKKKYYISAKFLGSKIEGCPEAMLDQQTSSRRYYQRPDADYLSVDSSSTTLSGYGGTFAFGKQANSGFQFMFNTTWRSPGLELNDVGYMRQANTIFQFFWVGYSFVEPFSIFRRINLNSNQWSGWDFGKVNLFNGANLSFSTQFKNLWIINAGFGFEFGNISNTILRGGTSMKLPANQDFWSGIESDNTKKIYFSGDYSLSTGMKNYYRNDYYSVNLTYRPLDNISFTVSPGFSTYNVKLQYVDEKEYNGEPRYIFGTMDQKTLALTARIDVNLTPDLTIQLYASPFVSAGKYTDYKMITDPKASDFEDRFYIYSNELVYNEEDEAYHIYESGNTQSDYSFDNPDFNFKQFRSNLVLRWEYTPGSLIYLVWSQGKTVSDSYGTFDYLHDMDNLFSETGRNTFLIKISYRLKAGKWL